MLVQVAYLRGEGAEHLDGKGVAQGRVEQAGEEGAARGELGHLDEIMRVT